MEEIEVIGNTVQGKNLNVVCIGRGNPDSKTDGSLLDGKYQIKQQTSRIIELTNESGIYIVLNYDTIEKCKEDDYKIPESFQMFTAFVEEIFKHHNTNEDLIKIDPNLDSQTIPFSLFNLIFYDVFRSDAMNVCSKTCEISTLNHEYWTLQEKGVPKVMILFEDINFGVNLSSFITTNFSLKLKSVQTTKNNDDPPVPDDYKTAVLQIENSVQNVVQYTKYKHILHKNFSKRSIAAKCTVEFLECPCQNCSNPHPPNKQKQKKHHIVAVFEAPEEIEELPSSNLKYSQVPTEIRGVYNEDKYEFIYYDEKIYVSLKTNTNIGIRIIYTCFPDLSTIARSPFQSSLSISLKPNTPVSFIYDLPQHSRLIHFYKLHPRNLLHTRHKAHAKNGIRFKLIQDCDEECPHVDEKTAYFDGMYLYVSQEKQYLKIGTRHLKWKDKCFELDGENPTGTHIVNNAENVTIEKMPHFHSRTASPDIFSPFSFPFNNKVI